MATIAFAASRIGQNVVAVRWSPLTQTGLDDGAAFSLLPGADRSVQVTGTFGVGGSVTIEGSNLPAPSVAAGDWRVLTDLQGNAITLTSANLEQIAEYTRWIRPRVTAGDGTTSLVVDLIAGG